MDINANLVERAKNGDSKAWDELYSGTHQIAFGVAMQLVKNKDTAEDIIQDSYITAFTKLDTLKEQDKFQHWFNRIVANNCKNHLVKKKPDLFSQYSTFTDDGEEIEFDVEDDRTEYRPDNAVISDEIKQLFYDMLAKLPEEQRACALMFWVQDLSIAEIADILEVSQNTVKSRIHYAKKKLTAEADDMKKRGESIFSITGFALIPFLRWLFKNDSSFAASPEKAEGILKICKSAGSMTKATGTAKAVAETVKTTAKVGGAVKTVSTIGAGAITKGIATKIIAGVLAAAIGIGGITLAVKKSNSDNVEDQTTEQLVESTEETPTKDEIIIAESVSDLGLDEEMVKAVVSILNSEHIGIDSGNVFAISPEESTEWFRTYWVYYYLTMNNLYDGNELKRNDEFQNEFVSKYGEYEDFYYPDKELCGIPDYNSFSKLYECLYGQADVENEYEKLKSYITKREYIPIEYGMKPIDIDSIKSSKITVLGENQYQIEYQVEAFRGEYSEVGNTEYRKYLILKNILIFELDKNSVLGFTVKECHSKQIDIHEDSETYNDSPEQITLENELIEETDTPKQEESTTRISDKLVEIDLFSTIDTIGIKTHALTSTDNSFPLIITFKNNNKQIDYGVCKISWNEQSYNRITYVVEYKDENGTLKTKDVVMSIDSPNGTQYITGEKLPAKLKVEKDEFKKYGFVFAETEKELEVDYVYSIMKSDNISKSDFNILKDKAIKRAQTDLGTVKYEDCLLIGFTAYGTTTLHFIFKSDLTGEYCSYYYGEIMVNQYGNILNIEEYLPKKFSTGFSSNFDTVELLKSEIRSSLGDDFIIEIKK